MARRRSQVTRGRRRHRKRRWLGRVLLVVALAGVGYLGWCAVFGLPEAATAFLLRQVEARGLRVEAVRLSVRPLYAVEAEDVSIGPAREDLPRPWLRAGAVRIGLSPWLWIREGNPVSSVAVRGADVLIPLATGEKATCRFEAEGSEVFLRFGRTGEWIVERFTGRICGIHVHASGRVRLGSGIPSAPPGQAADARAPLVQAIELLERFEFAQTPLVDVRFEGVLGAWDTFRGDLRLRSGPTAFGAYRLDGFEAAGGFRAGRLEVRSLRAHLGESVVEVEGVFDPASGEGDVRILAELGREQIEEWFPSTWLERVATKSATIRLHAGPGRLHPAEGRADGEIQLRDAWIQGVEFRRAGAHLRYVPGLLRIEDIDALQESGRVLQGEAAADLSTGDLEARLRGTVRYGELAPWFSDELGDVLASTRIEGSSEWTLEMCGLPQDGGSSVYRGGCGLTDVAFSGVPFDRVDLDFRYDGKHLDFDRLELERPEGRLSGMISYDFHEEVLTFDVGSSLDPLAIAELLGDNEVAMIQPYRFEGSPIVSAKGLFAYDRPDASRAEIRISGERLHWWRLFAERASADLKIDGRRLEIDPLDVGAYGGTARCRLSFDFARDPPGFEVELEIPEGADFEPLVEDISRGDTETKGRLSGTVNLAGRLGEPETFVGVGSLRLDDGLIWRLALFGELSRMLARIVPGVGVSRPYRASAGFTFSDGWIRTDDLEFVGEFLSLDLVGKCDWEGNLDFIIRAHVLRETFLPAQIIGLILDPLFEFLEFDLEGTLWSPVYRPIGLPRELFGGS